MIASQPAGQVVFTNMSAQMSVTLTAGSSPPLYYQWRAGSGGVYTNLADGGGTSGSSSATLSLSNIGMGNSADYVVVVTNAGGAVTSSVAHLTVVPTGTYGSGDFEPQPGGVLRDERDGDSAVDGIRPVGWV